MLSISQILKHAAHEFAAISSTPSLDAELLLAHVLKCSRTFLHTWPEREISSIDYQQFTELAAQHLTGIPIAYLLGEQAFWKFTLQVTPDVLIPRPETELMIEIALELFSTNEKIAALDLGTGSGAIALALAYEKPIWDIIAVDKNLEALALAQKNAELLGLTHIHWMRSNWYSTLSDQKFNLIVSNPPYIEPGDPHLQALTYEPQSALVAEQQGLADLAHIICQSPAYLLPHGYLIVEHGYNQALAVQELMQAANFLQIKTYRDLSGHLRVTCGQVNG